MSWWGRLSGRGAQSTEKNEAEPTAHPMPYRYRRRRRTTLERVATAACVGTGLAIPLVWERSPIAIEGASSGVIALSGLALMTIAVLLSMMVWRRRGSQGSLRFFTLCLIAGALVVESLHRVASLEGP